MRLRKILMRLTVLALGFTSLFLSGCGGGSSSPQAATVTTPVAVPQTPPAGYGLPTGAAANSSTLYITSSGGVISGIALPQGIGQSAIQISAPAGILLSGLIGALIQQFNTGTPLALLISSIVGGTVVNVSASPLTASSEAVVRASAVTWHEYSFPGITATSTPAAVSATNGVYMGVNDTVTGGFLAFQSSTESTNPVNLVASASSCNTTLSTQAVSIAYTPNGNFIGIGTEKGELLAYGLTGSNANKCENLTSAGKVATNGYVLGSPIGALSFTSTSSNNYGYFGTQNGQIWRIIATTSNEPQQFTQINNAGNGFVNPPTGTLTALYSDASNNVYVGTGSGVLYLLTPTNSAGNPNTTWTSTQLIMGNGTTDTAAITSISATTAGGVIAVTANGVYNIALNI